MNIPSIMIVFILTGIGGIMAGASFKIGWDAGFISGVIIGCTALLISVLEKG